MKLLNKTEQIAHLQGGNGNVAIQEMLTGYRSTPHPATGATPYEAHDEQTRVDVGDRWDQLCQCWESHADDHGLMFYDNHMLMSTLGAKNEDLTMKLLNSLRKYVRDGSGPNCEISREVGLAVCEAFVEADKGHFDKAVEIFKPLRYKVDLLGGSRAQRDVYELF
ncbi:Tetratricopeptide repeat protein 38 [Desmophyllum pertusum]|uniref:Tetratricopeptide repeat protein 38 n=1 Tax=Desmophyllum pertusum TaxID=174260 RepID=A0A9W9Z9G7_9CNID|nr:Tetratricopeptide repeat protein 38 [Desmophyllum pertusum]